MVNDFFLGFACHAHTRNGLEVDPNSEIELRKRNSPEEAQRLTGAVLDKLEKDIYGAGYDRKDVKLLILYLSYRGETEQKDRFLCESILKVIEKRFSEHTGTGQLRLIGHTTAGEIENQDLVLKEVSGIGYNGLSLLALVTSLPIGVGRTWNIRSENESVEQGGEMARDAWVDFNGATNLKEHIQLNKTLFVLTQGPKVESKGLQHFLAQGIANFIGSTREARIMNVIGGASGDGGLATLFHQFCGRLDEGSHFKVFDDAAVCALIPNLLEPSIGLDVEPTERIGRAHRFRFDSEAQPQFMYVTHIDDDDPRKVWVKTTYESEARISRERGMPMPIISEEELFKAVSEFEGIGPVFILPLYGVAFPFGNYTMIGVNRIVGQKFELMRPVRSYSPEMDGYIVRLDYEKVQKGAHNVYNMLRMNQDFGKRDVTLLVSCITRRLAELLAASKSRTEAEIFKEALSSTQVLGFLAYGEMSFTHLLQEPYIYNCSCWGVTLRSQTAKKEPKEKKTELGIKGWIKGER